MKKLSTIIMALALVLGMSQCKKQETPTTGNTTPTNPGVHITVNVGENEDNGGKDNNGERHNIAPANGLFAFTDKDVLYVGHDGKFVGTLKFKNGFFSGTIYPNDAVTDQPLHFYFLGNAAISQSNDTIYDADHPKTSFGINIADQSENLPVLSYGASTKPFTGTGTTYSTTLKNKCALVRFDLQNQGDYEVTLSNVPTLATVNFADPTAETAIVATEGQTNANMTLYGEEGNTAIRWAILLPGTNLSTGHSDLNITYSGNVNLAELAYNDYVNSGISINNPLPLPAAPDAQYAVKTSGDELTQFSVSANKKVYFSKANLRYNESSGVWSFHDNQIDGCFGYVTGSTPQGYNVSPNGSEMDRFCWGFQYPTTTGESDYVDGSRNLNRTDGTDWGCALTGEGNNNWRTLTAAEWNYLLNNANRGSKRFMKVSTGMLSITDPNTNTTYDGLFISGLFIAPDNFDPSQYSFTSSFVNKSWNNTTCQGLGIADANTLLAAGCVFLPALGYRDENGYQDWYYYSGGPTNTEFVGYYWSATGVQQNSGSSLTPQAEALQFDRTTNTMPSNNAEFRNLGMCVRLVWDAN